MTDFTVSFNTVATMFLLICAGFIAKKLNWIDQSHSKKLSDVIVCLAMPFLMISALVETEYSTENLISGIWIMLASAGIHIIAIILGYAFSYRFKDSKEQHIFRFAAVFENAAFYGFPVLGALLGTQGLFWGAFYSVMFNLLQWTVGMYILGRANPEIKMSPKKFILNFGTIPCLIGIVLYISQIQLPEPITKTMSYLGSMCTPVSMIIIGVILAQIPYKKLFSNAKVYLLCICKLLVLPLIVAVLCLVGHLPREMAYFCVIMAAMPSAATSAVFAEKYDIAQDYAALCVGISTLLSVGTIPLICWIWGTFTG